MHADYVEATVWRRSLLQHPLEDGSSVVGGRGPRLNELFDH
jgi:hypothetical protein